MGHQAWICFRSTLAAGSRAEAALRHGGPARLRRSWRVSPSCATPSPTTCGPRAARAARIRSSWSPAPSRGSSSCAGCCSTRRPGVDRRTRLSRRADALRTAGARLPVPVDDDGLDVDGRSRAPDARLVYVTPSHQYPLGIPMSLPRRLALLRWARASAPRLEDDYDSDSATARGRSRVCTASTPTGASSTSAASARRCFRRCG